MTYGLGLRSARGFQLPPPPPVAKSRLPDRVRLSQRRPLPPVQPSRLRPPPVQWPLNREHWLRSSRRHPLSQRQSRSHPLWSPCSIRRDSRNLSTACPSHL